MDISRSVAQDSSFVDVELDEDGFDGGVIGFFAFMVVTNKRLKAFWLKAVS